MKEFKKLNENKKGNFFTDNVKSIVCLIVGLVIGILVMAVLWPDRIATLKNGEQRIMSVDGYELSADDLYNKLKESNPVEAALDLIHSELLHKKYPDIEEEAVSYAKSQADEIISNYETYYGYSEVEFLEMNGLKDKNALIETLTEDYYYQKFFDEYAKGQITDDDINDFYKDSVIGDKEIAIFTAEDESVLKSAQKELKKGTKPSKIQSNIDNIVVDELEVSFKDKLNYTDDIWKKIKSTKAGNYSEIIEDSTYGYVLIYVKTAEDKPALIDIKDDVEDLIVQEIQNESDTFYYEALEELRKDSNFKIYDTELEDLYKEYVKSYK